MKKGVFGLFLILTIFSINGVFAVCNLDISLINQDPYPAIPGEEVKVMFQIDGLANPDCETVRFELIEKYPITLSPGQVEYYTIDSGIFKKNYKSSFLAPFNIIVSSDSLDGQIPLEIRYKFASNKNFITEEFYIEVEDILADFEIYVKDYDSNTRTIVFEILNIAKSDIEALTVEIPKQENIMIKGSKVNIAGDLDSNEYLTVDFEAIPKDGEIVLKISYSDKTNVRRTIEKTVVYESEYFQGRIADEEPSKVGNYIIIGVLVLILGFWIYRRHKKKKEFKRRQFFLF